MTNKLKCPKCLELRESSCFHNETYKKASYWCTFCVKDMQTQNKHRKEKFKRNSSPCDSRLADKELANELKEEWERDTEV